MDVTAKQHIETQRLNHERHPRPELPTLLTLVGVAVCVGLEKVLIWLTSDPPSKSEMELEAILKTIQGGECQVVEFNDGADLEKIGEAVTRLGNTKWR